MHVTRRLTRLDLADCFGDGAYVVGRGATAAADQVDEAVLGEAHNFLGHFLGCVVVLAEGVGQAGVRIAEDPGGCAVAQRLYERAHLWRAKSTVESHADTI